MDGGWIAGFGFSCLVLPRDGRDTYYVLLVVSGIRKESILTNVVLGLLCILLISMHMSIMVDSRCIRIVLRRDYAPG